MHAVAKHSQLDKLHSATPSQTSYVRQFGAATASRFFTSSTSQPAMSAAGAAPAAAPAPSTAAATNGGDGTKQFTDMLQTLYSTKDREEQTKLVQQFYAPKAEFNDNVVKVRAHICTRRRVWIAACVAHSFRTLPARRRDRLMVVKCSSCEFARKHACMQRQRVRWCAIAQLVFARCKPTSLR